MSGLDSVYVCLWLLGALIIQPSTSNFCTQEIDLVNCKNHNLFGVPTGELRNVRAIDISENNISSLNDQDFHTILPNVQVLYLNDNHMSTIDPGTFTNLPQLQDLYLQNNNLSSLPDAIASISHLKTLDVRNNQDATHSIRISDSVAKEIGDTLQKFSFGSPQLQSWPSSLSHFQDLQELTIDMAGPGLDVIPPFAFHSFESTLKKLTIQNTHLLSVPIGISNIRYLHELHFDNNPLTGDKGMIMQAFFRVNSTLQILSLRGDRLTTFPRALRYLTRLQSLDMSNNDLSFVSEEVVRDLTANRLILSGCKITRIPGALATMRNLIHLDLSSNHITSLENNDLDNLHNLEVLVLDNNDITFVSNSAFKNVTSLRQISIKNTHLTEIPEAFEFHYPPQLEKADLTGNDITCMCKYSCMARNICRQVPSKCPINNYNHSTIIGNCGNIQETIPVYFQNYVSHCPEYISLVNQGINCGGLI